MNDELRCVSLNSALCIQHSALVLGGDERVRTDDPLLAKQVLSQLSYTPKFNAEC